MSDYTPLQDPEALPKAIRVTKLDVQPGEVLCLLGENGAGNDLPPWIPTHEDLRWVEEQFKDAVPDARMVVTHQGVELTSHEAPTQIEISDDEKLYGGTD